MKIHRMGEKRPHCGYGCENGVRGFISFVRETLTGPWVDNAWVKARLNRPYQLRLLKIKQSS